MEWVPDSSSSQLDHAADIVVSIFLTSRNRKDSVQVGSQYISGFRALDLVLLSALK